MEIITDNLFEIQFCLLLLCAITIIAVDIFVITRKIIKKKNERAAKKALEAIVPLYSSTNSSPTNTKKSPPKDKIDTVYSFIKITKTYTFIILNLLILPLSIYGLYTLVNIKPAVAKSVYNDSRKPITIIFNSPIYADKIDPHMNPEILGEWKIYKYFGFLPFTRKIEFIPQQSFLPEQKVMIYVSYIANPLFSDPGNEHYLEIESDSLPLVTESSITNEDTDILTDQFLVLDLNKNDSNNCLYKVVSNPEIETEIIKNGTAMIIIKPKQKLPQNTNYQWEVFQTPVSINLVTSEIIQKGEEKSIYKLSFTTVAAPLIKSVSPSDKETGVKVDREILIEFGEELATNNFSSYFRITPEIEGEVNFVEEKKLTFKPKSSFNKDTEYQIILTKGIASKKGGIIENDIQYQFKTIGPVEVISFSPGLHAVNIDLNPQILITFNEEVNHASAESKFKISPAVSGTYSWNGNTLIFTLENSLSYSTSYNVTIEAGIESIDGLASINKYVNQFTTRPNIFSLNVPLYSQAESYTCNIAAARMMLSYRGVSVSESTLKNEIGIVGTRGSGNPHKGYVENYGTYWEPISTAVSKYRSNQIMTNWNLTDLLSEVEKGNPVMVWGQNGWSTPTNISWTATDGTYIYAVSGMHSYIVKGFTGTKDNPDRILINDPWRGDISLSKDTFNNRWSYFKTAMIVY